MSVHVFVNLFYELKKEIECEAVPNILSIFHNAFKRSGFRPGPTQTRLYSYVRWLEA